jgi:hypothetical protein
LLFRQVVCDRIRKVANNFHTKAIAFSEVSRSGCENFTAANLVAEQIVQHNKSDRPHPIAFVPLLVPVECASGDHLLGCWQAIARSGQYSVASS